MIMPEELERTPAASFANYFEVGCTEEEIIIRFGIRYAEGVEPSFHTLITTPGYARELVRLLEETLRQHASGSERKLGMHTPDSGQMH
jgi:hypothetical protein